MARGFGLGGGSAIGGDALPEEVLEGKTGFVDGKKIIGTMIENGTYDRYITGVNQPVIIPEGHHSGDGYIQISPEDKLRLIASNIREGVTILGCVGTLVEGIDTSDATATASDILSGKTAYVKGNKITGTITSQAAKTITPSTSSQTVSVANSYCSGAVTVNAIPNQQNGGAWTPSTSAQTMVAANKYLKTAVTVNAIPNQVNGGTWTPSMDGQTMVAANKYLKTAVIVNAIPNQTDGGTKYATTSAQTLLTAPKYLKTDLKVAALSQSGLTTNNILYGKTITISNGSSNVWSVSGNYNTIKVVSGSLKTGSTNKKWYWGNDSSTGYDTKYISITNHGITPLYTYSLSEGNFYLARIKNDATKTAWAGYNGSGGFYNTNSLNSGWRFTSSAIDIPGTRENETIWYWVFGY